MARIKGWVEKLSGIMDKMAAFAVVLTMLVIVANIILRSMFHEPLSGIMDYVMILTAVTIALALASCAVQNGHIAVDLIIDKFPVKVRNSIDALTNFVSLIFWILAAIFMFDYANNMAITGTLFPTSQIPFAPVLGVIGVGILALAVVLSYRLLETVRKLVI
ncbi:MAG: TRAP transporter small permease [Firmicutes bacterium]|nr:TRAP transporter small permease [Bacillota bacterium]